jgi:hypothetical protein
MVLEFISLLVCLWVATKVRGRPYADDRQTSSWALAKRSLRWGTLLVTVPLLACLGAVRYVHGAGVPSAFAFLLCTGVTALVMLGCKLEITRNLLLDCLIVSTGLTAACFTVVNGIPVAVARMNAASFCAWSLACVGAAVVVRTKMWISGGG